MKVHIYILVNVVMQEHFALIAEQHYVKKVRQWRIIVYLISIINALAVVKLLQRVLLILCGLCLGINILLKSCFIVKN